MNKLPQIVPISDIRIRHGEVLEKLENGPVILAQRSRPAAVLISVEEWDKIAQRMSELEEREVLRRRLRTAHTEPDVSVDNFMRELNTQEAMPEQWSLNNGQ